MTDAMWILIALVAVVIALLIAVPVACKIAVSKKVQQDAETIGTAEEKPNAELSPDWRKRSGSRQGISGGADPEWGSDRAWHRQQQKARRASGCTEGFGAVIP